MNVRAMKHELKLNEEIKEILKIFDGWFKVLDKK